MYLIRDVRVVDYNCRYINEDHLKLVLRGLKCNTPERRKTITIRLDRGQHVTVSQGWLSEHFDWVQDFEPLDSFTIECLLRPYTRRIQDTEENEYVDQRLTEYLAGHWR